MDLSQLTKQPRAIAVDRSAGQEGAVARQRLFKVALKRMEITESLGNACLQRFGVALRRAREQLQGPLEQLEGSLVGIASLRALAGAQGIGERPLRLLRVPEVVGELVHVHVGVGSAFKSFPDAAMQGPA